MRCQKPSLCRGALLFFFILIFWAGVTLAQEKPGTRSTSSVSAVKKSADTKSQPTPPESADPKEQSSAEKKSENGDGPEQIRKREEWFYKQRSSVKGHIPAGARFKAFQHMQRMMEAEGKLVRRPDGSYAEIAPQSFLSPLSAVTSTWSSIGPTPTTGGFFSPVTGRITTIAVDPSDSTGNTVLIGGAMGGIWRSTDAGASWTAVGDQNASLAMGSIAFAPSNSSIVYAGTGEQALAFDTYYGAGVLKSSDHGQTWTQTCTLASATCPFIGPYTDGSEFGPGFGFLNFGGAHISYVAVSPSNPNMVLAGVQFIEEGPEEGVYCSDNGGSTWTNILPDEMSTFVGFATSTIAYAAFGNPAGSSSGAPNGNGIYKATAIGSTCSTVHFARLTSTTLPLQSSMGRIDLGIAPSDTNGNTVYASIADATTGSSNNIGVFVTTNGGTSWTQTSAPDVCQHQCWYDNVVKVDPTNKNIVYIGGSSVSNSTAYEWVMRSTGGTAGGAFSSVLPAAQGQGLPHVDVHAITLFKASSGKVLAYLGNDGGIWRSGDAEASTVTWTNLNNPSLTLTQFYPSISINPSSPSNSFGGTQDNGSQNYQGGTGWVDNQLCGDGASSAVDSIIPSTVYIGCATGYPVNASYQNGAIGTFSPAVNGISPSDLSSFIPPLLTDPNTGNVVYFGTTKIYQSFDAGNTWTPLSADMTGGSNGVWLNAIAVEPGNSNVVYAGNNAGGVYFNINVLTGGSGPLFFNQVNQNGLPPREVTSISIDPSDSSGKTVYVAFSAFSFVGTDPFGNSINDPIGHIFKTIDSGNTWTDVSCSTTNCSIPASIDLPNIPVNDIVLDPNIPNILYAATDLGVFMGNCSAMPCTWTTVGSGLPRVAVLSLRLHEPSRTLRAASHGRGAWDINLNNFTFSGPHISSIAPISANVGVAQFTLTVNGSGLTAGTVQWNGSKTNVTTTQVSDTQLTATIAAALLTPAGTSKITVVNGTQTSNSLTFAVLAGTPTITSINPPSTPVQTTTSNPVQIQLTGTNFATNAKVLFNGAQNGVTVAAPTAGCPLPTCLSATLPALLLTGYGSTNSISVLNLPPGGGQSKPLNFQVVAPPPPNDNFASAITINNLNFFDFQDSSGATTESADPTPPCAHQYTSAQGNTGGHPNGAYNTIWYTFTPVFSASLFLETQGSSYDTVLSVWTGTGTSEATLTATNLACNDDVVPGVQIQSQITSVSLTAGTTYYIMVSSFGPPDPNPIALGGRAQFHAMYNGGQNPSPTVTTISPTSAPSGGPPFMLTADGTGFLSGAQVNFNGTALTTTFVSSTQLTATVQTTDIPLPETVQVRVDNPPPGGFGANSIPFTVTLGTYPVPTLNSLNPNSILATTPGMVLNASGNNFASTAVLTFNGVAEATTVSNAQQLSAVIPASQIGASTVGTVQVTVSNPTPGGGTSSSLPFQIIQANPIPSITSINPSSVPISFTTNMIVTITGANFQQGAILYFAGGSSNFYLAPTFVSSTQLTFNSTGYFSNPGTYSLSVIDPSPGGYSNVVSFTVTGPPDFSITSSGATTQTVSTGQTATFTSVIAIAPQNGFSAQVNLTCALPTTATATTCTVNPASFPNGSGTASVMVTTMARGIVPPMWLRLRFFSRPQVLPVSLLTILLSVLLLRFARARRQRFAGVLPLAILVLLLAMEAIGCGGSSYTPPPPPPPPTGTPAGTYTITVTATSGILTHSSTLTLTVQ